MVKPKHKKISPALEAEIAEAVAPAGPAEEESTVPPDDAEVAVPQPEAAPPPPEIPQPMAEPEEPIRRFPLAEPLPSATSAEAPPSALKKPKCAYCGFIRCRCSAAAIRAREKQKAEPPSEPPPVLTEEVCKYFLQMVGGFNTMAVALTMRIPVMEAGKIWGFSKQDLDALAPPSTKVLNKHLPDWFKRYQDEFALAMVLMPMLTMKMAATITYRHNQRRSTEKREEQPAPPASGKTNGSGQPEEVIAE